MSAPDVAGEVVAYRAWQVDAVWEREAFLLSMNGTLWPADRWLVAECPRTCGATPGERCTCGVYAARDRSQLVQLGYTNCGPVIAMGEVGLVGKVIPGTQGWRAERARIIRLWLPHQYWRLVEPLRSTYGVPVSLANTLRRG